MSKLITNSSHGPGRTCLAFSKDGLRAFTGGQDCIVRIWKMNEGAEQEPETAGEADGAITSVAASDDCWLSTSEDADVRRYLTNMNELDSLLTTVNGVPARCVAIDPKGKKAAVGSDEFLVKVIDLDDTLIMSRLEGYKRGVRGLTWHPNEPLLTTCGSDGTIIVWDTSKTPPTIEKSIEGIIPAVIDSTAPEFLHDCSAVWHTSGEHFFTASRGHEIVTISRSDWSKTSVFKDAQATGVITALAISVNGVYLASASQSKVYIWSTQTRRVIASHDVPAGSIVTQLAFSPKESLLAWTDTNGVFSRWSDPLPDGFPDPVRVAISSKSADTVPPKSKTGHALFEDPVPDDVQDLNLDMREGFEDDWLVDDLGTGLQDDPKPKDKLVKEMVSITKAQPSFQPGSTPMENKKQYLAYNLIGVIEATDQDTHQIINVEFFDRSTRKGYHFTSHVKYDLGYLGECGAVYACAPEDDHSASILFKPYGTWALTEKEWTYEITPKGTSVLGVAAGGVPPSRHSDSSLQGLGNVVIATSENDLTFLSGTGRERRIIGLGGDFVTMVAGPEWVFVVYRAGSTTIDGSQNLSYCLINFDDFTIRQRDTLPIPKGHTLSWVGLTEQGVPAIYDSSERVHILTKHRIPHHGSWTRFLDAKGFERRQGKDESYWPVGINESTFMCLILKGRQKYPGFPRPLIQEIPIHMPFRQGDLKLELIEREALLLQIAMDALDEELTTDDIVGRERAMDKEFILLIQAACKADNIPRAIELTKLLHQTPAFDIAMKVADFYHLVGYREKIEILKANREENEDRLVLARNKRRRWLKPDPPLRQVQTKDTSSRMDPLGDVRPPPAIPRPGMTRVTVPVIEPTLYGSTAPPALTPAQTREETPFIESPTSQEGKRKRAEFDESISSDPFSMPPPKQKANPFARKAAQEVTRNPFARKADVNKQIQKSESFFEKVGAAEFAEGDKRKTSGAKERGKEKEKEKDKKGSRQTTLFGMLPSKPKPSKKTDLGESQQSLDASDSQTTEADVEMSESLPEQETLLETPETDAMIDNEHSSNSLDDLEETQPSDEALTEEIAV